MATRKDNLSQIAKRVREKPILAIALFILILGLAYGIRGLACDLLLGGLTQPRMCSLYGRLNSPIDNQFLPSARFSEELKFPR